MVARAKVENAARRVSKGFRDVENMRDQKKTIEVRRAPIAFSRLFTDHPFEYRAIKGQIRCVVGGAWRLPASKADFRQAAALWQGPFVTALVTPS